MANHSNMWRVFKIEKKKNDIMWADTLKVAFKYIKYSPNLWKYFLNTWGSVPNEINKNKNCTKIVYLNYQIVKTPKYLYHALLKSFRKRDILINCRLYAKRTTPMEGNLTITNNIPNAFTL